MKTKKSLIMLASLAVILLVGVVGTLALLITQTNSVENTFVPGNVSVAVSETFDNETKTNVSIKNTGNVDAYIRVAIIPTWEDSAGNPVGVSASLDDLTIDWGPADGSETEENPSNNWEKGKDGFWYYTSSVSPQQSTTILIDSATVKTDSAGYNAGYCMNLQILAQGIQSVPTTVVTSEWDSGVNGVNGSTLQIITNNN